VNSSLVAGAGLERNTPTLLNAALQPDQFYDSRVHFLEDQVHAVVSNKAEMGGHLSEAPTLLRKKGTYAKLFAAAFANEKQPVSERNIRRAVAAYVRSLVRLNSRFDDYLRGDTAVLNNQEVLGFNLFMGKAQCGTCHYMPLFNGAVPPLYDKTESEVLGVPATADAQPPVLDADPGKFLLYGIAHQKHAFKTPTVRNAALTAPYMHNGVYQTLEQVVDFYNQGGGAGLGLSVPTQTLAPNRLDLSQAERQALIAFIKTLSDAQEEHSNDNTAGNP
jgi:cytochrome c peroxidase